MEVRFKWIGGATWLLDVGDVRIGCDPVLCPKGTVQDYFWFKARRRDAPVFDEADLAVVDLWLLTHPHEDHLDAQGIARITDTAQVIARANVLPLIPAHPPDRVRTLAWGERAEQTFGDLQVTVEAIPAIHGVNPLTSLLAGGRQRLLSHPAAGGGALPCLCHVRYGTQASRAGSGARPTGRHPRAQHGRRPAGELDDDPHPVLEDAAEDGGGAAAPLDRAGSLPHLRSLRGAHRQGEGVGR